MPRIKLSLLIVSGLLTGVILAVLLTLTILPRQLVAEPSNSTAEQYSAAAATTLKIATVGFKETSNPAENGPKIRQAIIDAAALGAEVVHFHEGALSGYGSSASSPSYNWDLLRSELDLTIEEAKNQGVWVILGSAHPITWPHKPHNSLYIISPTGAIVDRYDKRFCTKSDLNYYTPGNHFAIFEINGIKCSALICYDVRFQELYREMYKEGVQVLFDSFHNARARTVPNDHTLMMRIMMQHHAQANHIWISVTNSTAAKTSWPGVFITPDGHIEAQLPHEDDVTNLMVNTVDLSAYYKDAAAPYRDACVNGKLNSGTVVVGDPLSDERTYYPTPPAVIGRYVFYNNSHFDGYDPAANSADDAAIAPDKSALLPGQTATFANYTSYSRGINGIMIDMSGPGTPTASDFAFRAGNDNDPSGWSTAPNPIGGAIRSGAGLDKSDRVMLIWADGAIEKKWLEVTVLATGSTGLSAPDVFYFGNAIGDTGNKADNTYVNAADRLGCRANPHDSLNPAPIDSPYDFNRDTNVDMTDRSIARENGTSFTNALELITP